MNLVVKALELELEKCGIRARLNGVWEQRDTEAWRLWLSHQKRERGSIWLALCHAGQHKLICGKEVEE